MSESEVNLRFRVLCSLSRLLWWLSCLAALLGAATVLASFRMPKIELTELCRWSLIGMRVGVGAIFASFALGWGHSALAEPFAGVNKVANDVLRRYGWGRKGWAQGLAAIALLALVSSVLIPGARYVHPEGNKWIAISKAGRSEVSASLARLYSWREIRMGATFVLGAVLTLGPYSWAVLAGIKHVQISGEDLVPRIVVHVRPRDYQG